MSEFHFSRLFKRTTGLTPSQYFIHLRMEKARRLLRETNQSVTEIGLDVGYTSPSPLAQIFRRDVGISPSEYRRPPRLVAFAVPFFAKLRQGETDTERSVSHLSVAS